MARNWQIRLVMFHPMKKRKSNSARRCIRVVKLVLSWIRIRAHTHTHNENIRGKVNSTSHNTDHGNPTRVFRYPRVDVVVRHKKIETATNEKIYHGSREEKIKIPAHHRNRISFTSVISNLKLSSILRVTHNSTSDFVRRGTVWWNSHCPERMNDVDTRVWTLVWNKGVRAFDLA